MAPVSAFSVYSKKQVKASMKKKNKKKTIPKNVGIKRLETVALHLLSTNNDAEVHRNHSTGKKNVIKKDIKTKQKNASLDSKEKLLSSDNNLELTCCKQPAKVSEWITLDNATDVQRNGSIGNKNVIKKNLKIKQKSLMVCNLSESANSNEESFSSGNSDDKSAHLTSIANLKELPFYKQPTKVFEWIIAPLKLAEFFNSYWEKELLFIKRNQKDYFNQIFSTERLHKILTENVLFYGRNVDIVAYENGKRETINPEGRAVSSAVWDYYKNGCSVRILNPHTYCNKLHGLIAALQEYFGCVAGINSYLTPPASQGFAPHYDDIEAFILQLEGCKHWKLYAPITDSEILPRFSSKDFKRSRLGPPIKEVTLEAGDLLYFPRGTIHEGYTDENNHSLHITVSVYQRTAYVDLLEHMLKPALVAAAQTDITFRKGLPLQYLKHVGMGSTNSSVIRQEIQKNVTRLFSKMLNYINIDAAADQMGKQFMWDSMPPVPSKLERLCSVHEGSDRIVNGEVYENEGLDLDSKVRLLRYYCLRLVAKEQEDSESEAASRIYYSTENAKYYHGEEQQYLEIERKFVPAVKYLVSRYPDYVKIRSLPLERDEDKVLVVFDLWERGLIVTDKPLQKMSN